MSQTATTSAVLRAIKLLGGWQKIRSGHLALNGLSCACNLGSGSLSASAFEQPFLDYLHDLHADTPAVNGLFSKCAYVEGEAGSLLTFLLELAQLPSFGPAELAVIDSTERSLKSFADNHVFNGSTAWA